jgi:hypothetical protein
MKIIVSDEDVLLFVAIVHDDNYDDYKEEAFYIYFLYYKLL